MWKILRMLSSKEWVLTQKVLTLTILLILSGYYFQVVSPDSLLLTSSGISPSLPCTVELQTPQCSPTFITPLEFMLCAAIWVILQTFKETTLHFTYIVCMFLYLTDICKGNDIILYIFIFPGLGIELKLKSLLNKIMNECCCI